MRVQIEWDISFYRNACGIYCFIHRETLRCYIGQTMCVEERIRKHIWDANKGSLNYFHKALRKYGMDAFDFEMIEECAQDQLAAKEEFWISFYGAATTEGFNSHHMPSGTRAGIEMGELAKKRISIANTGKIRSPEAREKVRQFRLGYKIPESTKIKMRQAKRPPVPQLAIENSRKFWTGNHHSEETKSKLRAVATGRKLPESAKQKLREFWTGRKHSTETIAKMKLAAIARGPSELRNQKLKEAWIQRRIKAVDIRNKSCCINHNEARAEN